MLTLLGHSTIKETPLKPLRLTVVLPVKTCPHTLKQALPTKGETVNTFKLLAP